MQTIKQRILDINWPQLTADMNEKGFALVADFLPDKNCEALLRDYSDQHAYRKTIVMERYRFGRIQIF